MIDLSDLEQKLMPGNRCHFEFPLRFGSDFVFFHQSGNPITAAGEALKAEFRSDAWTTVNLTIFLMNDLDFVYQNLIFFFTTTDWLVSSGVVTAPR